MVLRIVGLILPLHPVAPPPLAASRKMWDGQPPASTGQARSDPGVGVGQPGPGGSECDWDSRCSRTVERIPWLPDTMNPGRFFERGWFPDMPSITINYQPTEKQKIFHASKANEILYGGAAGGGKLRR